MPNFNILTKWLKSNTNGFIITDENNQDRLVVLPFKEYQQLFENTELNQVPAENAVELSREHFSPMPPVPKPMQTPKPKELKVSILIPCYNEELTIERCVLSCLEQSLTPEQIIVVDDCSTDGTPEVLARYQNKITAVRTPVNTGNKSSAQEYGLTFVTGDIVAMTDADTMLHEDFTKEIAECFNDPSVSAVSGVVRSMKYNWLTRCRAFEYVISNNIHKLAQSYLNFMLVIPGASGAFRTDVFRNRLTFDHDTITEDLDFTYKLHKQSLDISYTRKAIVYTQDPATVFLHKPNAPLVGGGWQNCLSIATWP